MAIKHFNADVRSTRTRLENGVVIPGIVNIERGDSDGEVVATFAHETLPNHISIRLLSQNVDQYPDNNSFLVFTDDEDTPGALTDALADLQNYTIGQNVFDLLLALCNHLNRFLLTTDKDSRAKTGTTVINTVEDEEDDEVDLEDMDLYADLDDDDIFGISNQPSPKNHIVAKMAPGVLSKIKRDLRKAREAGVKVGILQGVQPSAQTHVFSLSLRAGSLGVSDEALEAWDVDPSDYVVLVIRVEEPYPSAAKVASDPSSSFHISYRFGKCSKYKPSLRSVQSAFNLTFDGSKTDSLVQETEENSNFKKVFISASLEMFMQENFLALFKLRLTGSPSWDDANDRLKDLFYKASGVAESKDNRSESSMNESKENVKADAANVLDDSHAHASKTLPAIVLSDLFSEDVESISTPLVAMQFATHHFVRCTEYCVRCHRRIPKEFEALKPFVCSDPLCLFQYITMGFGPSIEHEILTQPYVVDLLVSLCYSSVQNVPTLHSRPTTDSGESASRFPIREFPTGLRLRVPMMPGLNGPSDSILKDIRQPKTPPPSPMSVYVNLIHDTMSIKGSDGSRSLAGNTWVVLQYAPNGPNGLRLYFQAHIKYFDGSSNTMDIDLQKKSDLLAMLPKPPPNTIDMNLYFYDCEFDDLDESQKATAMRVVLESLPPISHLREYLIKNPHQTLKSCGNISSAALTLLEWIVASNRSYIVQVSPVEDKFAQEPELLASIKIRQQEMIPSMGDRYVQFRFAQGNPDKELRFHRSLREIEAAGQSKYPTIFAWHGSSLHNWHSILRQGLDFKVIQNGRAYGSGVYFSPNFHTSIGYMQPSASWPNSALGSQGVIALCEIINSPQKFQSHSPHYVVQQLDWIQCRYLFVSQDPRNLPSNVLALNGAPLYAVPQLPSGGSTPGKDVDKMVEIDQDPAHPVMGPLGKKLEIPLKALPDSRTAQQAEQLDKKAKATPAKRRLNSSKQPAGTDEEDADDISALFSDEEVIPPSKRSNATASRESSVDTTTARQLNTKRPATPPMTDFRPGTLNLDTIPRLGLPQWMDANSTKRLTQDIKLLQKVQATTSLRLLGWYMDFEKIDNMFQWIVELHSFDPELPLAKDMKKACITSVVLEVRFGREYPFSPPFVRVIRPQFLPFANGGGGHVTIGGAICMEMLTSDGWTPATSMEAVFVSIKMAMSSLYPKPARLLSTTQQRPDYNSGEALSAFQRAAMTHGWKVPTDTKDNATQVYMN